MTKFIMMCGLPASGKSTIARERAKLDDANIHSSDEIRAELSGDISNQNINEKVFQTLHKRIKDDLENGKNTIYDATNITYKRRMAFLREIERFNVEKICYFAATSYENCIMNDNNRQRQVGTEVIKRMYSSFWIPQVYEGWDEINVVWDYYSKDYILSEHLNKVKHYDQDSPHHTLTLGEHLRKTKNSMTLSVLKNMWIKDIEILRKAAELHDIGKPFTRAKHREKDHSTYYQHHLIGGYMSMFLMREELGEDSPAIMEIAQYIQWHMYPYNIEKKSTKNKAIQLLGEKFFKKLMALHRADKAAH